MTKEYKLIDKLPLKFYLNAGVLEDRHYDTEPIMMEVINNIKDVLVEKGYDVKYENFYSGHDYLSWGETLANGLIALIGKESV
ncbi:hypothetical protein [Clostridium sp. ATCC 25772]|uniref:hypothetical protein n=1 Tax=Clostridium sp. ATCC 25772 TaxID=1676991 RepID=UPI0007822D20|nr:hypothetical protein [Clostridium sp. ATCC 25772]